MKTRLLLFAAVTLLALKPCPTFGMSVPVADDSSSSTKNTLTLAANIWPVLYVNEKQTAFVRFNWLDTNVLPATFTPADISSVTLRLFVASAVHPADLTVHVVNTTWNESTVGNAPQVSSSVVATIPAASVVAGHFVSVDVTEAVMAALQNGTDYGFAIQTASPTAKIVITSKEDEAHGYPAELDIEGGVLAGLSDGTPTNDSGNTAVGVGALPYPSNGNQNEFNTAIGAGALAANTAGSFNVAVGLGAITSSTSANDITAVGMSTTCGSSAFADVLVGVGAICGNGSYDISIGQQAGSREAGDKNIAIGGYALFGYNTDDSVTSNIAIGYQAGNQLTTGSNNIYIANEGSATESNTIRLGDPNTQTAAYIAGISGVTVSGGAPVYILSNGQLGTLNSSSRFKTDIAPMGDTSNALYALHPVTFHYKPEYDSKGIPQYGLIAEDVEKVSRG